MALFRACARHRLTSETSFCLVKPYRLGKGFRSYGNVDAILWWCLRARRCCLFRYFVRTEDFCRSLLVPEKMTQFLPPNLLALFAPRDPIPYLPPVNKLPHEKKNGGYIGVGGFLKYFEVTNISSSGFIPYVHHRNAFSRLSNLSVLPILNVARGVITDSMRYVFCRSRKTHRHQCAWRRGKNVLNAEEENAPSKWRIN